ncbi:MAG: hypothetical protein H0W02_18235 [Ktedonobacteraceae bacterium]|nr:hypothetical protein [Ktedonobacteraceae bacterium]
MKNDPTDIWAWVYPDVDRLIEEGGEKRVIAENYIEFMDLLNTDHAAAEIAISRALEAARATGEIHWELHLRHWRLQLWLRENDLKRMLPEAIDLLTLATDERVRDVPQRICAYHDVVECYVMMDAAGFYDEIVENSRHILAQLPRRHSCADCARSHIAHAAAAAGRVQETEHWVAQCEANLKQRYAELIISFGRMYEALGQWQDAERYFTEGRDMARQANKRADFQEAMLGIARARLAMNDKPGALEVLQVVRQNAKYGADTSLVARLLAVEGYSAESDQQPGIATSYFTRSARHYLELGCYRDAALISLHAAEVARDHELPELEDALALAARAVGHMPPASRDVYARLTALGRQPVAPEQEEAGASGAGDALQEQQQDRRKLKALEDLLQAYNADGQLPQVAATLYALGNWHTAHGEHRAAVDYYIWNAALERLLKLPMSEREDALAALQYLRERLPANTIEGALTATESGPSIWLVPALSELPEAQWRWVIRSITTEIKGQPVVEPEPQDAQEDNGFNAWLEHTAGMLALLVRAGDRANPARREQWALSMDEVSQEIKRQVGPGEQGREVLSLVQGLTALSRGAPIEEVRATVLPPFDQVIEQIGAVAEQPVWFHPGSRPLDFLVEQAAQKAVTALRTHDEHRARRLANLAFRYELMTLDLRAHEQLEPIAHFLDALGQLVLASGASLPTPRPPLEEPFDAVLAAVYQVTREQPAHLE